MTTMRASITTSRQWSLLIIVALISAVDAFVQTPRIVDHHGLLLRHQPVTSSTSTSMSMGVATTTATKVFLSPVALSKIVPVVIGCGALSFYHTNLQRRELNNNEVTWRISQADTRQAWSKHVRDTEGWLYAIQTLRNAITANTFLATTVLSLLTVITGKLWSTITTTTPTGSTILNAFPHYYPRLQFAAVALSFLRSAYEFLQSARLMTHAGFMFPVDKNGTKVDSIMRKSSMAQWLGLRWLYIGGTMMVWTMAGELPFLIASLGMVRFFRNIDQAPQ